jgi:hypothetical protein
MNPPCDQGGGSPIIIHRESLDKASIKVPVFEWAGAVEVYSRPLRGQPPRKRPYFVIALPELLCLRRMFDIVYIM